MLYHMFLQTVQTHAQRTALVYDKVRMSYQDLYAQVVGLSKGFRSLGIQPSSRVALVLPNCPEFLLTYYALAKLQAIFVPLDPSFKEDELTYYLSDSDPCAVITDLKRADHCRAVLAQLDRHIPLIVIDGTYPSSISFQELIQEPTESEDIPAPYEGDMVYHYSSGSTGRPKRVCRTQKNLFYDGDNTASMIGVTAADTILCTIPMFHSWGQLACVLMPIHAGATLVILEPFVIQDGVPVEVAFAARCPRALELIEQERVTLLPAVPYIFSALAETPPEVHVDLSSVISAGSFLSKETFDRFLQRFGIPIRQLYGTTEGGLIAVNMEAGPDITYNSVGLSPKNVEVKILAEDLTELPCGSVGEVVIKSPTLTTGYANMPALNRQAFRDGYYFTGDLGRKDEQGRLFLSGRKKFVIDTGGHKVDPLEVEDVLMTHANVAEAAVVGIEGPYGEEIVKALVVPKEACTEDELISYCKERLADFKVPRSIEFRTELPKSALGKVLRGELLQAQASSSSVSKPEGSMRSTLLATEPGKHVLEAYLHDQVAEVLQVAPSELDVQQPLNTLGLDSLMVLELKSRLETALGITVSVVTLLQGTSIVQLAMQLLDQLTAEASSSSTAPALERVREYPLSYGQRALWYIYQLAPESAAYNTFFAVRILSSLDIATLRCAFQHLVDRHASLRTTYTTRNGKPVQQVHEQMQVSFEEIDASHWNSEELSKQLSEEAHRPFNLERDCLLRICLFTGSAQGTILLLTVHHIASELGSLVVLMDELRELYRAGKAGTQADLPFLELQYSEYVQWEAEMVVGPPGERPLAYWQRQLAGELPVLSLPTDRPRPALKTYRGARHRCDLGKELVQQLRMLAKAEGVTLYITLLAAFQVLLYRYTGQEDILVGSPTTTRSRNELQHLVGYLINPVVLRANLANNPSFRAFLRQVSSTVLAALDHREYPFPLLVEHLQPQRDASRSPIFDVLFVLDRLHRPDLQQLPEIFAGKPGVQIALGELLVESFPLQVQAAQFDLTLLMVETDKTLLAYWDYNTDLFDEATIARMAEHYSLLLKSIVVHPEQRISNLPLLTEAERHRLLVEWDNTQVENPQLTSVHEMFEFQVEQTPNAIAVSFDEEELSYADLNARSNQVAHGLRDMGVTPTQPIAIMLTRSPLLIVALLGVLKAGCPFVCLDPQAPINRLRSMLTEIAPPCVISESSCLQDRQELRELFHEVGVYEVVLGPDLSHPSPIYRPEKDGYLGWTRLKTYPSTNLNVSVSLSDPAYLAYTSGSTGTPKGIVQSHRNFCQFLHWFSGHFHIQAPKRIAQWSSITFDPSLAEIFGTLCFGATLCMTTQASTADPAAVVDWIRREQITLLQTVPTFFRYVLNVLEAEHNQQHLSPLPSLESLLITGEMLPVELADAVLQRFGRECTLYNLYGPTEAILATCYSVEAIRPDQRSIAVGRPIAGRHILILDAAQQLCPIGVGGELYIRSPYLAEGYFRRPEETQEVFIQNPLHQDFPDRVYRTGDVGRWLPDGTIEFYGRRDHQVKIRGMRVELEEIEAVLSRHESIRACAVVAHDDGRGELRLVAYLVPDAQWVPDHDFLTEVQAYLRACLPDYMLPAAFIIRDSLPLTSSGKVDRRALPVPDWKQAAQERAFIAPRTPIEEMLASIWAEVLGLERVGIHDHFFELGGHSLLATQVVARVRDALQVELGLRTLFEAPTVAQLAGRIETTRQLEQEKVASILEQVKQLSDDEVRSMLARKRLEHEDYR